MKFDELIHGDSVEILKDFPDNSVHAIISDIPYGIGHDEWDVLHNNTNSAYGGSSPAQISGGSLFRRRGKPLNGWSESDRKIPLEYYSWCSSWSDTWLRILKPGGSCIIMAGRRYSHRCIAALEDSGFTFRDMLAWEKDYAPCRAQRLSAIYKRRNDFKNASKWEGWRVANLSPLFEPVLWFQKPYKMGGTIADNVIDNDIGAWNENAMKIYNLSENTYSNVIRVKYEHYDHGLHSAQKPLMLMKLLVSLVTIENQIILDPFMGSGTTCVASMLLKRHYIGIDINYENVRTAQRRLNLPYQCEIAL